MSKCYDATIIEESTDYINYDPDYLKVYLYEYLIMLESDKDIVEEAFGKGVKTFVNNQRDEINKKFVKGTLVTKKSIVGYFLQLIQKIIGLFKDKMNKFYKHYNSWLTKASQHINDVNFDNLTIKADRIYIFGNQADKAFLSKMSNRDPMSYADKLNNFKGTLNQDYLKVTGLSKYVDDNGSLAGGLKNCMRYQGKVKGGVPETFSGTDLRKVTELAIDYCLKYEERLKYVQAYSNRVKSKLKALESRITQEGFIDTDSYYSLIGECYIDSEGNVNIQDTLLEADMYSKSDTSSGNKADTPKSSTSSTSSSSKSSSAAPKVEVGASSTDGKGDGTRSETLKGKDTDETFENIDTQSAKILRAEATFQQILIGAFLTVSEERYNTYIKICKYVFSKSNYKFKEADIERTDLPKEEVKRKGLLRRAGKKITNKISDKASDIISDTIDKVRKK